MIGNALLIARREWLAFLVSPFSYAIAGFFFALNGLGCVLFLTAEGVRGNFEMFPQLYFTWFYFWFPALFIPPLLTMRLLAEEFRTGTIEMLMTAPSSDGSVVLGKYLAALGYAAALWLPTVLFFVVADQFGANFDWGVVAAGYLGAMLVYALFLAVGVFTSALTETPILSGFLAIMIELALFFVIMLRHYVAGPVAETIGDRYAIYNILSESLLKGVIDSAHLLFFFSAIALFLFIATRSLEFRRWR